MRVQITARHCEVSDTVRDRTEMLLGKLRKYDPRVSSADVVFEEQRHSRRAEAVLAVDRDEPVVASGEGADFTAALDQMVDRLAKILRRRRSQVRDHQGRSLAEEFASE
jgi:putative sigma-54 modulation protein